MTHNVYFHTPFSTSVTTSKIIAINMALIKLLSYTKGLLKNVYNFVLHSPKQQTLIKFKKIEERLEYNERIMQRIGMNTNNFSVLNIHKIGINAPVHYIFDELKRWNGDSTFWPNYIAKVDRIENNLEHIRILPFGWQKYPFSFMKSFFGIRLIPLFLLNALRIKSTPDSYDSDNARYLLYQCSGGYPIGIFAMYTRSSIPSMGETTTSQLIVGVSFNFYGRKNWHKKRKLINRLWEWIHNRVTANVLNRLKHLSEDRITHLQKDASVN